MTVIDQRELEMSILFLDPLVLATYAVLGVFVWCVWVGRFRSWFGHDAGWTVVAWPLPFVTGAVPVLAGMISGLAGQLGIGGDGGGPVLGAVYLGAFVIPWVVLCVVPPRWLLPGWARDRLVRLPPPGDAPVPGAVPATNAWRGAGHGSRARWTCRVDAVPGYVWVDGDELRFRALPGWVPDPVVAHELDELDDADVEQLNFAAEDEFRLQPPTGGWWTRRSLDVQLAAVDRLEVSSTRPWADDGLLTLEVAGRRVLRLWVADVAATRAAIAGAAEPAGS